MRNVLLITQLYSEECRDCRRNSKWWAALLIGLVAPTLVVIILWINIDIYKWFLNSLIFHYQIANLLITTQQSTDAVLKFIMGAVDLRDVELKGGFCLFDGFNDLHKMVLGYISPFMMMLTLLLIIIFAEKCSCSLSCEQVNTFRAILFVMIMPYQAVIRISLDLLKIVEIDSKYRAANFAVFQYMERCITRMYYAVSAIFLVVVVIVLPFCLIVANAFCIRYRLYMSFMTPVLEGFLSIFKNNLLCHSFWCVLFFISLDSVTYEHIFET